MKIKKTSETRALAGNIVNAYNDNQTSVYSTEYTNDCNTYSTDETFTGKYWIDNKPIYRKYIACGKSNSSTAISHGIQNIDSICDFKLFMIDSTGTYYPIPWWNNFNEKNYIKMYAGKTQISKDINNSWNFDCYAILEYTKTTD